jgi:hypothetical protein
MVLGALAMISLSCVVLTGEPLIAQGVTRSVQMSNSNRAASDRATCRKSRGVWHLRDGDCAFTVDEADGGVPGRCTQVAAREIVEREQPVAVGGATYTLDSVDLASGGMARVSGPVSEPLVERSTADVGFSMKVHLAVQSADETGPAPQFIHDGHIAVPIQNFRYRDGELDIKVCSPLKLSRRRVLLRLAGKDFLLLGLAEDPREQRVATERREMSSPFKLDGWTIQVRKFEVLENEEQGPKVARIKMLAFHGADETRYLAPKAVRMTDGAASLKPDEDLLPPGGFRVDPAEQKTIVLRYSIPAEFTIENAKLWLELAGSVSVVDLR